MINLVILSLTLLTNEKKANIVYTVTSNDNNATNQTPTGRVYLNTTSSVGNWTNYTTLPTNQLVYLNTTNTFTFSLEQIPKNTNSFFRLNWKQSTVFSVTFTYTSNCPREVSFYCGINLGRLTMTNGQTFNILDAYKSLVGQLPCGQTVNVRDYQSGELLLTIPLPYPCDTNEYELKGGWSNCP